MRARASEEPSPQQSFALESPFDSQHKFKSWERVRYNKKSLREKETNIQKETITQRETLIQKEILSGFCLSKVSDVCAPCLPVTYATGHIMWGYEALV